MDRIVIGVGSGDRFRDNIRKYVQYDGEYHDIIDPTQEDLDKLYSKVKHRLGTNRPNVLYVIYAFKKLDFGDLVFKARHLNIKLLIFANKSLIYVGIRKNASRIFYENESDIHNGIDRTEIKTENTCYCYNVYTDILSLYELDHFRPTGRHRN
jgi:hypothetical protein